MTAIKTEEDLRAIYGHPDELALKKSLDHLDQHCRDFIAASPFFAVATHDGKGSADASPRGDSGAAAQVLDSKHLLLPDHPGNNRLDTLVNLIANPEIGLLFLVPGTSETLRVNGLATIHNDDDLRERFARDGKLPKTVIKVEVQEAFLHCAKSLMRSKLWKPETWPAKRPFASPGRIWNDHIGGGLDPDALDAALEESMPRNLY